MKRKIISWLSLLIVLIFLGCREELDYFNEKQPQTSYNFSKENVITNILKKTDYEARPFLKPSVDFVNAYLKSHHTSPASSSAKITAADISGIDLYTDVVEEVKYGNADYYSFYVRGKDENGFEQKLVVKAVNNQVVNKYLLRYKRINGFTIDPNSYQTIQWTGTSSEEASLISSEHTVMVNCTVYTTINYDCGEGGHHVGMVCPTSHEYVPMPILVSYVDLNCLYGNQTGGAGPSSGSSGTTGSTPGNSGGSSSGSGNPDFYVDDTSDPTPPLITLPTSAPLYDIKGQITGSIKNPPDFNPLNLTPAEITLINSKNEVRLELYKYLALHYAYPFSQGTILMQELIDYVKFVLQYFVNHPNATWQDYYNDYLDNPCVKAQLPVGNINTLLHDSNISSEMNALKDYAATNHYEYGAAIINTGNSNVAQTPYTNNDPNNPGHVSITIPPVGNYLASAHTHPDHGAAPPSVRDLYSTLENARDYPSYQGSFVFSHNGSQYAFVVNDRAKAIAFLTAFPFASNTTNEGRIFNENSQVGRDFLEIYENYMKGRLPSYSGSSQNDGMESAYTQILEKYDTGISFAKADANGNLKPLKPVSFPYEIPASGGKKITGYKAQPCS